METVPVGQLWGLTRSEVVAKAIENRISNESIPPGTLIGTKDDLRLKYGVARATINESVRLLTARGVVAVKPGQRGGVFVAERSASVRLGSKMLELTGDATSVADCLQVRNALEPEVIMTAARHRSKKDARDLTHFVEKLQVPDLSPKEYLILNFELHARIAHIVPNTILRDVYLSMLDYVRNRVTGVSGKDFDLATGVKVHVDLINCVNDGDLVHLERVIDDHQALKASRLVMRHEGNGA